VTSQASEIEEAACNKREETGILKGMPESFTSRCQKCGKDVPEWSLSTCPMCGKVVCLRCGHTEFGRVFCASGCAASFFHGDGDEDGDSEA
jgi:hypothetical protein